MERGLSEGPEATPKRAEAGLWLPSIRQADIGGALFAFGASWHSRSLSQKRIIQSDRIFRELTMATWIKCTNTKKMPVYINLDNAVTVMRDDSGLRIDERGTVIEFMGGEQVYIVVTEQPEEIIKPKSSA
jgi:hypothetical protein